MKYGLAENEIEEIVDAIKTFPQIEKAILFGSRALGTQKPGSDIDIAIFGKTLTFDDFLTLKVELEKLEILQELDIIRFESIQNSELIDHITRVGILLY